MQIVVCGNPGVLRAAEEAGKAEIALKGHFSARFLERWDTLSREMKQETELPEGAVSLENGLFQALWLLGTAAGSGLTVYRERIPMNQITLEICEFLNINPYLTPGRGYVALREGLPREGETPIGYLTPGKGRIVIEKEGQRFLTAPERGY